jgi:KDO2-lipid IV(A) lauroyltransferase
VKRNLQFCYPEWSKSHIDDISKKIFQNAGITLLEVLQFPLISRDDLLNMFRIKGEEHLAAALELGKGVIIISGHLGNWEVGPQFLSCYFGKSLTGIARKTRFAWLDACLYRLRTRFGNRIIYKKGALRSMIKTLRRGEMLGVMIDQSRRKNGVEVLFFGKKATATSSVALLALRCKSPVLPMFCVREADGELTIYVKPPLELGRTKNLPQDLQANTQIMVDAVEEMVRQYPEQWAWYQRPWKKDYPDLYPEWEARRKRRKQRKRHTTSKPCQNQQTNTVPH